MTAGTGLPRPSPAWREPRETRTRASDPPLPGLAVLLADSTLTTLAADVVELVAALDADPMAMPAPVPTETPAERRLFDWLMGGPGWREGR